jgi:hypothetical protein
VLTSELGPDRVKALQENVTKIASEAGAERWFMVVAPKPKG